MLRSSGLDRRPEDYCATEPDTTVGDALGMDDSSVERIRFRTETGSIYVLERFDSDAMLWHRESTTLASGVLRTEAGILTHWPSTIELGECVDLWCYPINPPLPRLVQTSRIVAFLPVDERSPVPA